MAHWTIVWASFPCLGTMPQQFQEVSTTDLDALGLCLCCQEVGQALYLCKIQLACLQ